MRSTALCTAAVILSFAAFPCVSLAATRTESEPNNTPSEANGPLLSGDTWTGMMNTANDIDYYALNVGPGTTNVHVTITNTSPSGSGTDFDANLYDTSGHLVASATPGNSGGCSVSGIGHDIDPGDAGTLAESVTGPARYYFAVEWTNGFFCNDSTGATYSFTVNSTPGLLTSPYVKHRAKKHKPAKHKKGKHRTIRHYGRRKRHEHG
jgi:hypothetical protein